MAEYVPGSSIRAYEVALALNIPAWKVIRWIQSGRLKGGKEDGRWWATTASVEKVKRELSDAEPAK